MKSINWNTDFWGAFIVSLLTTGWVSAFAVLLAAFCALMSGYVGYKEAHNK